MISRDFCSIVLGCMLTASMGQSPVMLRQSTGASGASAALQVDGHPLFVQQSVGQASVIGSYRNTGTTVRQGFLQPLGGHAQQIKDRTLQAIAFPDPFVSSFTLRFDALPEGPVTLELVDLTGRHIWSSSYAAALELFIQPPQLAAGSYLLRIRSGARSATLHLQHQP